jgi:hypothetical protein
MHAFPDAPKGDTETLSPTVAAFLEGTGRPDLFTEADDVAADHWAAAVSVFELIAEGNPLEKAIETFAAGSSMSREAIAAAAKAEIATLGIDDVDTDNGRAAIELYLALMVDEVR